MNNIRPSIEGQWYPKNREHLLENLKLYLRQAEVQEPEGKLYGLIVPHAGHIYSGQVAAHAFKCIIGMDFDTVVIVSPSHFLSDGNIISTSHDYFQTPIGSVEIDRDMLNRIDKKLRADFDERIVYIKNDPEHAIEVELPFLQLILKDFRLVPIMLFDQSFETVCALGRSLAEAASNYNVLLVASSDLSHFYNDQLARKYDKEMLGRIEAFDPEGLIRAEIHGKGFACGRGAVASVLTACRELGAGHIKILDYRNSGDITGDYDSVVGYGAAVIYS